MLLRIVCALLFFPLGLAADVTVAGTGVPKARTFPAEQAKGLIEVLVRAGPITCANVWLTRREGGEPVMRTVNVWRIAAGYGEDFPLRDGDVVAVPEHVIGCLDRAAFHRFLQRYLEEKKAGRPKPAGWDEFARAQRSHAEG